MNKMNYQNRTKSQLIEEIKNLHGKIEQIEKSSELALEETSKQLKNLLNDQDFLLNNIRDFVYRHNVDGVFYYLSPAIEQITGYKPDEWKKHYSSFLTDNPINKKVKEYTDKAIKSGETQPPYLAEVYHRNGTKIMLEINERPYFKDGQIEGIIGVARDITDRINTENILKDREEKYRNIFQYSPLGIFHFNEKGIITNLNDRFVDIIGSSKEVLMGLDMLNQLKDAELIIAIKKALKEGIGYYEGNYQSVTANKITPVRAHFSTIYSTDKKIVGGVGIVEDISDRVNAEMSLQKKNQEFQNLLKTARHLTESLDINDVLNKVAIGAMEILNAASFCIYLLESDNETLKPVVAIDPDYEEEILATPIKIYNSFTGQSVISKCGLIFNETGDDSAGYQIPGTPEETEERLITVPFIVEDKVLGAMCISRIGKLFTNQELALAETYAAYASAALKNARLYNDLQQEVEERKHAQDVLYDLNIQYKSFIQNSMVGIWKLDFEKPVSLSLGSKEIANLILETGVFSECNDAFAQMYGFSESKQIIGKHNKEFSVNRDQSLARIESFVLNDFKTEIVDNEEIDDEGNVHNFRNSYFGVIDKGFLRWVWGIQIDITEQKKLESQLFQSQKMEAIGNLAGGIAHDFNNLLTVINGHAEIGLMKVTEDHPIRRDIAAILFAGKRAENLTRQLLAFSRKQIFQPKIIELNSLITGLDKMLRRLIGEDIIMKKILSKDDPQIKADPGQIEQILINLIVNARDAINMKTDRAAEKRIIIETEKVFLDKQFVSEHDGSKMGWHVCISVSDNGTGISDKIKENIFEPFFTTKEKSRGTGLGLATVYGIVKQNNGCIYAYSKFGEGTTFKIYWPNSEDELDLEEGEDLTKEISTGTETIVLVEDDKAVRDFASAALKDLGYTVFEAVNGKDALELIDKKLNGNNSNINVDLIITDMVMPEMNGRELAAQMKKICPESKIIFASGYTDNQIVKSGSLKEGINFIQKPFSINVLAEKVRNVLDSN